LHGYGIVRYGERQADLYLEGLLVEFQAIAEWPLASRERTESRPPLRLRVYRGHNILYVVRGDEALIVRVLHHSADWMREI
jgi:toxin ParE1/3/4